MKSIRFVSCDEDSEQVEVVAIIVNVVFVTTLVHNEVLKFDQLTICEFVNHLIDCLLDVVCVGCVQVSSPYSIPVSGSASAIIS